ncbi:hypothetical protein [Brochothrix thermosphacta]|nr:hypothetical protein [Brochothrix thermosphacta]
MKTGTKTVALLQPITIICLIIRITKQRQYDQSFFPYKKAY